MTDSEYTPTTEELRVGREAYRASGTPMSLAVWLAAHDAEVREAANWIIARIVSAANKGPLEGEDGFILGYQMAVGPIHAAIPFLQKQGIVVTTTGEIRGLEITETEAGRIADRTIDAINRAGGLSQHIENLKQEDAEPRAGVAAEEPDMTALRAARAETWDEAISAVFAWWSAPENVRPAAIVNPYGLGVPVKQEGAEK